MNFKTTKMHFDFIFTPFITVLLFEEEREEDFFNSLGKPYFFWVVKSISSSNISRCLMKC
jgi:hypothetical protein